MSAQSTIARSLDGKRLSIVVPAYNEAEVIPELYRRVVDAVEGLPCEKELIVVNDGSTDGTEAAISELCDGQQLPVRSISLSRNFGHQMALLAGLDHAAGDLVIEMDADLQHPPELIPDLVAKWQEGYDVVFTVREEDEGRIGIKKRITSWLFYRCFNNLARLDLPANGADFRLMDGEVVRQFVGLREIERFERGLIRWLGFRQIGIPFSAPPRFAGVTKYSFRKMMMFALDGLLSFSVTPLRLATFLGLTVSFCAFAYAFYAIGIRILTSTAVPGWTSTLVSVLILSGAQLVSIGVLGEYVGRSYMETKGRPPYVVRSRTGFDDDVSRPVGSA